MNITLSCNTVLPSVAPVGDAVVDPRTEWPRSPLESTASPALQSPEGTQMGGPLLLPFLLRWVWGGEQFCISNIFPDDVAVGRLEITLEAPLLYI